MTISLDTIRPRAEEAWAAVCDQMALKASEGQQLAFELLAPLEIQDQRSAPRGYTDLPADFHARLAMSFRSSPSPCPSRALDLMLIDLIRQFEQRFLQAGLPRSLLPYYHENIGRILQRATIPESWANSSHDDIFLKDLGILRMWLIPCASHLVFRNSGVPRSLVICQRPGNLIRALTFFGLRSRGFSPFLENHVHPKMLGHFNPDGRQRCYQLVTELLEHWPENRGLMGISWYYDPKVQAISPRLAYLREAPERSGALFLPAGSGPDAINGATSTSTTRRTLYEQGQYSPTRYLMAWCRSDLMRDFAA